MTRPGARDGSDPGSTPGDPLPVSDEERARDRRALKLLVLWLGGCAALAALYLVLAIYLDWV